MSVIFKVEFQWRAQLAPAIVVGAESMPKPLVSVVMPVFNSRPYISDAVQSILAQTFLDFEFIIVDDGSNDGTADILRRWAAKDERIRLIHQSNRGVSAASNRGLELAQGEFYARMDHDDIALPHRLERQVHFLRNHPECVAVGGQVLMIDCDGFPIRIPTVPQTHEQIEASFTHVWSMFHPTLTARTAAVREVGGYSNEFNAIEDLDLFIKLAEKGRLANLPEVVLQYRQHIRSMCYTQNHKQLVQMAAVLMEAQRRRGKPLQCSPRMLDMPSVPVDPKPWRETHWSFEKMWAWWALTAGYVTTARRHALRALRLGPLRQESWLLLWCAMRGH